MHDSICEPNWPTTTIQISCEFNFRQRIQEGPSSIRGNKLHKRSFCNQGPRPSLRSISSIDSCRPSTSAQRLSSFCHASSIIAPCLRCSRQRIVQCRARLHRTTQDKVVSSSHWAPPLLASRLAALRLRYFMFRQWAVDYIMALKAFEKEIGTRLFAPCNKSASSTKKLLAIGLVASCDKSILVLDEMCATFEWKACTWIDWRSVPEDQSETWNWQSCWLNSRSCQWRWNLTVLSTSVIMRQLPTWIVDYRINNLFSQNFVLN